MAEQEEELNKLSAIAADLGLVAELRTKAIELITQGLANEDIVSPALYTLLASLYMEQNQLQKGYDMLDAALLKYPDNAQIYFEYGLLFM